MKLIVICAWCKKFIRFKDAPGEEPTNSPLSHGICENCKCKLDADLADRKTTNQE